MEGGANVIGEAVVYGVPVLASRIPGTVGLLGPAYPGYFPVGDAGALARLLRRAEVDAAFRRKLGDGLVRVRPSFLPTRERDAWRRLIEEL